MVLQAPYLIFNLISIQLIQVSAIPLERPHPSLVVVKRPYHLRLFRTTNMEKRKSQFRTQIILEQIFQAAFLLGQKSVAHNFGLGNLNPINNQNIMASLKKCIFEKPIWPKPPLHILDIFQEFDSGLTSMMDLYEIDLWNADELYVLDEYAAKPLLLQPFSVQSDGNMGPSPAVVHMHSAMVAKIPTFQHKPRRIDQLGN